MGTVKSSTWFEMLALNSHRIGKKMKKNTGSVTRNRTSFRENLRQDIIGSPRGGTADGYR